jgi:acyl-CoA thioester hydrolase
MNAPETPSTASSHTALTAPALPPGVRSHHRHPVRIYWEDTDAGGIVFYGNYLKFMERARTEWLRSLGFDQEGLRAGGEGMFVVAETSLRYLQPARLDDVLTVTVTLVERGRASVAFEQQVWRDNNLLNEGRIRIGWVQTVPAETPGDEPRLKTGRIPQRILDRLPEAWPDAAAPQD